MRKTKQKKIHIKPSEEGSLTAIAKREGGLKKNGEINRSWMRKKLKDPNTSPAVKKKLNFAINMS